MNHMSRERITFDQRIRLIRENYGSVSYQAGFITACSYTWMLTVNAKSTLQVIGLNDFKKMLRVVKHQLDPDDYWMYLGYWREGIADQKTGNEKTEARLIKFINIIRKEEEKMPAYVFEDE